MRARFIRWLLLAAGLAACPPAFAWEIAQFDARVAVHSEATATVTETIQADFGSERRHGIYRDIPVDYADRAGQRFRLRLHVQSVTDAGGYPWRFRLESAGRYLRVRIGDPDSTVTGQHTFRLSYLVERGAVRFFPDHDECYWNLTGNEWAVPIRRVHGVVELPPGASGVRAVAYLGEYGARGGFEPLIEADRVVFDAPRGLQSYEGLTVAVAWAKGAVRPPAAGRVAAWWLRDNWYYGLPVLALLAMGALWYAKGRDPRPSAAQVVEYAAPDGLTPAEVGTLLDQEVHLRDITATVIDLAVRGYLRISPVTSSVLGFKRLSDYELTRLKPWSKDQSLKSHERTLLKGLFGESGASTKLSDLEEEFYTELPAIRDGLYSTLVLEKYFDKHPQQVRRRYLIAGAIVGILATQIGEWAGHESVQSIGPVVAGILSGLIVIGFSFFMPRRSLKGARATDRIAGLQEFLRRTDKDRLQRLRVDPSVFETMLPYAMVFGIANHWARAFEGLYTTPPAWYGGTGDVFSTRDFTHSMNRMMSTTASTFTSHPRGSSSSFGGSGFGGGGGSGGGGGGGGGGAW
jgi:hypothetical protein